MQAIARAQAAAAATQGVAPAAHHAPGVNQSYSPQDMAVALKHPLTLELQRKLASKHRRVQPPLKRVLPKTCTALHCTAH
jgi:hypothetical protein